MALDLLTTADGQQQDVSHISKPRDTGRTTFRQPHPGATRPPSHIPQLTLHHAHQSSLYVRGDEKLIIIVDHFPGSDQLQLLHNQHQQQNANDQRLSPNEQRFFSSGQLLPSSEQRVPPSGIVCPPSVQGLPSSKERQHPNDVPQHQLVGQRVYPHSP